VPRTDFTPKEKNIIRLKTRGCKNTEIAEKLNVSRADVSQTLKRISHKIKGIEDSLTVMKQIGVIKSDATIELTSIGQGFLDKIQLERKIRISSRMPSEMKTTKPNIPRVLSNVISEIKEEIKSIKDISFRKKSDITIPSPPPKPIPRGFEIVDRHPLYEPFVHITIAQNPKTGVYIYIVDELQLDSLEQETYDKLTYFFEKIEIPPEVDGVSSERSRVHFCREVKSIIDKYRKRLGWLPDVSWYKIMYHAERNFCGYGKIDALMRDPHIERIYCSGVNAHIAVCHKDYGTLKTNVIFNSHTELECQSANLVRHTGLSKTHDFPFLEAYLPGKHKLAVVFRSAIAPFSSTFTIEKFPQERLSIINLVKNKTMSKELAAYLWLCVENRASVMIVGGKSTGKTTAINALSNLIPPHWEIVTIEKRPRLGLMRDNWTSLLSTRDYASDQTAKELIDLLEASAKLNPHLLIIDELEGPEAKAVFNAIAVGINCMFSICAKDLNVATRRLIRKPMDVPSESLPLLNIAITMEREKMTSDIKVTSVDEIVKHNKYSNVFKLKKGKWKHKWANSTMLKQMVDRDNVENPQTEIGRRGDILAWMEVRNISKYRDVNSIIAEYYSKPKEVYDKIEGEGASKQAREIVVKRFKRQKDQT
jgi:flagellar protein FlaI